jgi:hypothetical protein
MAKKGPNMKRTNIYLGTSQHRAVTKEAKKLRVSASKVIRDLIDEGLLQRDYEAKLTPCASPSSTAPHDRANDETNQHLSDKKTA